MNFIHKEKKKLQQGASWEVVKVLWWHSRKHWVVTPLIFLAIGRISRLP